MLDIQKYLMTHTFGDLVKEHEVYPTGYANGYKFSLNYDMIGASESDKLAQQCRGLILGLESKKIVLDPKLTNRQLDDFCPGETRILACPFNRFFNYGQGSAASINWNDPMLHVMEKLDGTLTILYWDSFVNEWHVATRAVPEGNMPINDHDMTFRSLFERALKETSNLSFKEFTAQLSKKKTYCFELCSPYNQVVVKYSGCSLTLLMIRDLESLESLTMGEEHLPEHLFGIPKVTKHPLNTIESVIDFVSNLEPSKHEGVVVCDSLFNRIKVKNPGYLAMNRIVDNVAKSQRGMMELIISGKDDDALAFLPEDLGKKLSEMKIKVFDMIKRYDDLYLETVEEANHIAENNPKAFAQCLLVKDNIWSAPMFQIFRGKAKDMRDFIEKAKKDGTWSSGFLDSLIEQSNK